MRQVAKFVGGPLDGQQRAIPSDAETFDHQGTVYVVLRYPPTRGATIS